MVPHTKIKTSFKLLLFWHIHPTFPLTQLPKAKYLAQTTIPYAHTHIHSVSWSLNHKRILSTSSRDWSKNYGKKKWIWHRFCLEVVGPSFPCCLLPPVSVLGIYCVCIILKKINGKSSVLSVSVFFVYTFRFFIQTLK